jgi:hypothetical protein
MFPHSAWSLPILELAFDQSFKTNVKVRYFLLQEFVAGVRELCVNCSQRVSQTRRNCDIEGMFPVR